VEACLQVIANADAGRATEVLLSFLPDALPTVALPLVRSLARQHAPRLRIAALCALATRPDDVAADHLLSALRDGEPGGRMAALYALDRWPHLWDQAIPLLIESIQDPKAVVAYWAIRLLGKLRHPAGLAPLIAGLEADARAGMIACFGALLGAHRRHQPGVPARSALARREFPLRGGASPGAPRRRRPLASVARHFGSTPSVAIPDDR
jgi:hypothetical protein